MRSKRIWGMAGHGHDASITVWYDTDVMVEHYTSEPYHKYEDVESLKKKFGAPDLVVWYENPYLKSIRQWWAGQKNPFQRNNVRKILDNLGLDRTSWTWVGHHEAHASWALKGPFDKALVFVIDSIGEWDCTSVWKYDGYLIKKASIRYPDSIGLFYSSMVKEAKLVPQKDEAHFESLAVTPSPAVKNKIKSDLVLSAGWQPRFSRNMHRGLGGIYENFRAEDLASATQEIFEELVVNMIEHWVKKTGIKNIILTGGCAYNKKIRSKIPYTLWVPPRPHDGGSAYSCVVAHNWTALIDSLDT